MTCRPPLPADGSPLQFYPGRGTENIPINPNSIPEVMPLLLTKGCALFINRSKTLNTDAIVLNRPKREKSMFKKVQGAVLCSAIVSVAGCSGDSADTKIQDTVKNPSMTEIERNLDKFVELHKPPSNQPGFAILETRDCTGFKVGVVVHELQKSDEYRSNLADLDYVTLGDVKHEDTVFFRGRIERISRTDNDWHHGRVVIDGKLLRFSLLEMLASIDGNAEVIRKVPEKPNDVAVCGRASAVITNEGELLLNVDMLKVDNSEFQAPHVDKPQLLAISSMSQADIQHCVASIDPNLQIARATVQFYGREKAVQTLVENITESNGMRCVLYGQESGLL